MVNLLFGPTLLRQASTDTAPAEGTKLPDETFMGEYRYHTQDGVVFRTSEHGKGQTSEVYGREEIIDVYGPARYLKLLGERRD